nr:MAG TPA: hypothetical protein [Caudoviricetes sp.]
MLISIVLKASSCLICFALFLFPILLLFLLCLCKFIWSCFKIHTKCREFISEAYVIKRCVLLFILSCCGKIFYHNNQ